MATFSLGGKGYHLRLTHGLIVRARADVGVDLYALADDPDRYIQDVIHHTYRLYPVVYAAVKGQTADPYEAWLDPLDGEAAESIRAALVDELASFFPGLPLSMRRRAAGTTAEFLAAVDGLLTGAGGRSGSAGGPASVG